MMTLEQAIAAYQEALIGDGDYVNHGRDTIDANTVFGFMVEFSDRRRPWALSKLSNPLILRNMDLDDVARVKGALRAWVEQHPEDRTHIHPGCELEPSARDPRR